MNGQPAGSGPVAPPLHPCVASAVPLLGSCWAAAGRMPICLPARLPHQCPHLSHVWAANLNARPARASALTWHLQEGQGFSIAMAALDGGRINIAACRQGGP